MTPEGKIKAAVKAYLKEIGAWYYMPVPMGMGRMTIDFLVCYKGKFYGIETKRPGVNDPTYAQALEMHAIKMAGGRTCLENDPALPAVRKMLPVD